MKATNPLHLRAGLSNLSAEQRDSLQGPLGLAVGILCVLIAGFTWLAVIANSDDPLSWFNWIMGFALPLLGSAAVLGLPLTWLSRKLKQENA